MTIETIKDVLSRILTINKNLTTESLRTLLDASGWDSNDIKEGMRIYSDYVSAGNDMTKVSTQRLAQDTNQIQNDSISIVSKVGNENKLEIEGNKKADEVKITDSTGSFNISNILDLTKDKEQAQTLDLTQQVQDIEIKKEYSIPAPVIISPGISVPVTPISEQMHKMTMEEEVHEIDEYIHEKPWGLITFNVALFMVTFSLLVYILLN